MRKALLLTGTVLGLGLTVFVTMDSVYHEGQLGLSPTTEPPVPIVETSISKPAEVRSTEAERTKRVKSLVLLGLLGAS
jgi:hypothetical protein